MVEVTDKNNFLFVEKYRPHKIDDCILPEELKATFKSFVNQGDFPNLLLTGTAGTGKTTVAKALCEELDYEPYVINASLDNGIDMLRNQIMNFASTTSLTGQKKCIILDEADYLTAATQPALRNFMESFSANCRFILTCNLKNKIIDALHSRSTVIEFKVPSKDRQKLMATFIKRCFEILKLEGIEYDQAVVIEIVKKYYPDNRRVLNELQRLGATGKIDTGALAAVGTIDLKELVAGLKEKDYKKVRKWVVDNTDNDSAMILRKIYDNMYDIIAPESIPQLVLFINEYQYRSAFVADQEINMLAFMTNVMADIQLK